MTLSFKKHPWFAFFIPISVFLISLLVTRLEIPEEVYIGLTYDLMLLSPGLYFLAIRKTSIPTITVVPVLLIGTLIGNYLMPDSYKSHFTLLQSVLIPLAELVVFGVIGFYSWRTIKEIKASKKSDLDFFQIFEQSAHRVLGYPRLAKIISIEFGGIFYALFKWKKKQFGPDEFTYQKDTGLIAILIAIIALSIVETFVLHILISSWSPVVAWILSIISIYTALMILAQIKAMDHRPHVIKSNGVELKNGLFGYAYIPFDKIKMIELSTRERDQENKNQYQLGLLGSLESHNSILHFHEPIQVEGPYGIKKQCDTLFFHVQDPNQFSAIIKTHIAAQP